jgi:hypothetical protein
MVVRIRLRRGSRRSLKAGLRPTAILLAALLTPAALMAWALGGWRLMADLKWTGEFAIRDGVFSHWQAWAAIAILVQFAGLVFGRLARRRVTR